MAVAWPRAVTGDGRSTTGGACRVNRIAIDDKATIPITTIKTFRISHCSALKEGTGAMAAYFADLDSLSRCLLLGVWDSPLASDR